MKLTKFIMTATMIVLALYDLVAVQFFGIDGSVSRWFQNTGFNQPFIVLVIGFLLGHFFGYMPPSWYPKSTESPHLVQARQAFLTKALAGDTLYRGADGYYVYDTVEGSLSSHNLRWIADHLDVLNADWDKEVRKALKS